MIFLTIFGALSSMGCYKETVGVWDNRSIDMAVQNWTRRGNLLEVNMTMRNRNFSDLPINSLYFNLYDEDGNLDGCSRTNYSRYDPVIVIKHNETYYIKLKFDQFFMDDEKRRPEVLEYDTPNNKDRTYFKEQREPGLLEGGNIYIIIGCVLVIVAFIIAFSLSRKRSFLG